MPLSFERTVVKSARNSKVMSESRSETHFVSVPSGPLSLTSMHLAVSTLNCRMTVG